VSSTQAAIVMTMEPVFAGFFGVFMGGNRLTHYSIYGAVCILAAMYIVQMKPHPRAISKKKIE